RSARELPQHRPASASARISAGPGYFYQRLERLPARISGPGKTGWFDSELGERRAAARGRRACRLRRALRAVSISQRIAHVHSLHHPTGVSAMSLPILPTTVVGSYSMPGWLERLKTEYFARRISRVDLDEIHDTAVKAAIKDEEVAGLDIITDGELRRDNM